MLRESEPRRLPAASLELIDRLAAAIRPDEPALAEWCREYWRRHRRRLAADLWLVERRLPAGARVLEYGAVPLLMTAALAERGYRVSALDVAPRRFAAAIDRLGLDVRACDVETAPVPFADGTFGAVVFNELFEHLRIDPIFTLREARRVLEPGGTLLLSTPNLRSFRGLRNLLLHHRAHAASGGIYQQYEKLRTLGHMGHVREYTAREVAELLGHVGFAVETVVFRGGHGLGVVGLAERLAPSLRPFFTLIATRTGPPRATDAAADPPPRGGRP